MKGIVGREGKDNEIYSSITYKLRLWFKDIHVYINPYDGEHLKATFSVSTEVNIENFGKVKMKHYTKKIIEINHNKYFIEQFSFK